jgi:TRAP-type C4-dicarboxylate transport system permease small subunit
MFTIFLKKWVNPVYLEERIQQSFMWRLLLKIQRFIAVITSIVIVGVLGIVVVTRYIMKINFLGYDEIILVAAYWMYFIGSSYASWEESHVSADILNQISSPKNKVVLSLVSKLIQVILGIPLLYLSFELLQWDLFANPVTIDWGIPLLIPQASIFVGFSLMTFYSFVYLLRDYHKLRDKKY